MFSKILWLSLIICFCVSQVNAKETEVISQWKNKNQRTTVHHGRGAQKGTNVSYENEPQDSISNWKNKNQRTTGFQGRGAQEQIVDISSDSEPQDLITEWNNKRPRTRVNHSPDIKKETAESPINECFCENIRGTEFEFPLGQSDYAGPSNIASSSYSGEPIYPLGFMKYYEPGRTKISSNQYAQLGLKNENIVKPTREIAEYLQKEQYTSDFESQLILNPDENDEVRSTEEACEPKETTEHRFIKLEGYCKDTRERCDGCLEKHKQTNFKFCHRSNIKKVNSICESCQKFFCRDCFKEVHGVDTLPSKIPKTIQETKIEEQTCSYCKKSLGTNENKLIKHTEKCKAIPRDNPDLPFICYDCGKGYKNSYAITVHLRRHTGIRPYKCEHCSYAAKDSSTLTKHVRTHTGERPYKCRRKGCKYAGKSKGDLIQHTKRIHN